MIRYQTKTAVGRGSFKLSPLLTVKEKHNLSEVYAELMNNDIRNDMIVEDVLKSLNKGRFPVLLTERRDHLDLFNERLKDHVEHIIVLKGGMGKKQLKAAYSKLVSLPDNSPRLILSTGRYLGEGFDDANLDTLFLALPISWKGLLVQYAGRLHRLHDRKKVVLIYDYADINVPMLSRMYKKRLKGYKAIGYEASYFNEMIRTPTISDIFASL